MRKGYFPTRFLKIRYTSYLTVKSKGSNFHSKIYKTVTFHIYNSRKPTFLQIRSQIRSVSKQSSIKSHYSVRWVIRSAPTHLKLHCNLSEHLSIINNNVNNKKTCISYEKNPCLLQHIEFRQWRCQKQTQFLPRSKSFFFWPYVALALPIRLLSFLFHNISTLKSVISSSDCLYLFPKTDFCSRINSCVIHSIQEKNELRYTINRNRVPIYNIYLPLYVTYHLVILNTPIWYTIFYTERIAPAATSFMIGSGSVMTMMIARLKL